MNTSFCSASVVISTYNRPKALALVLQALSEQEVMPEQILIGDDGSKPETRELIEKWADKRLPIQHHWHEDQGYRKTIIMNRAFSHVTAPLTIFLDGDCIPGPEFVKDHLRLSQVGYLLAGPRILASPSYTNALESGQTGGFFGGSIVEKVGHRLKGEVNRLLPLLALPDASWRLTSPFRWELVRGCNFSVPTECVWEVNGFEESLYGWGPDDSDIAVRLINNGIKVKSGRFACPVLHLWHKEESRDGLSKNREYLQTAITEKRVHALRGLSNHGFVRSGSTK